MSSKLKKHTARSSDETEDDFEDDMGGDDLAWKMTETLVLPILVGML